MASIKNSYLHKVFYLEDSGYRKYFLVTDYNKKSDIYDVIECYPDGEPMTSGYQAKVLASNMKKVNFIEDQYKEKKTEPCDDSSKLVNEFIEASKAKEEPKKKMESSKEEDPILVSWRNMKLKY